MTTLRMSHPVLHACSKEKKMASSRQSLVPGIALIVLGLVFLIPNFTPLRPRDLWPAFVLGTGLFFYVLYLADRSKFGLLMPGTILTVIGLLFFYCVFEGWYNMRSLWPLFIIAPGLGLLMMYQFGRKEKGLLIPGSILSGIGILFLVGFSDSDYLLPVILIGIGILLLFQSKKGTTT